VERNEKVKVPVSGCHLPFAVARTLQWRHLNHYKRQVNAVHQYSAGTKWNSSETN
jgi:hypothetical protein